MKVCFLDFEYNRTSEPYLNLVSLAVECYNADNLTYKRTFWLHKDKSSQEGAKAFLTFVILSGYHLCSYSIEAESRAISALLRSDIWMKHTKAIDLYLEYRCLLNHNNALAYGPQYIDGKIIKTTPPPSKWELMENGEDDNEQHHKPSYGLAAACFKLLNERIDADEKTAMRDLIISADEVKINNARIAIQKYNESDIKYLPRLLAAVKLFYHKRGIGHDEWLKWALSRGDYAIRTAKMVGLGYPINVDKLNAFTSNTEAILKSAAEACLESTKEFLPFRWDKRLKRYVTNTKLIQAWIERQEKLYWRKTTQGALSLSKDAFNDWYDSRSDGFAGAYCRYLKTKQSLNGFLPGGGKRGSFRDYLGSDNRVRPHFNIYGSKSSRSQPAATGFIPLKAHWMRNFIEASEGRALAGIDYSSQEFLIAALMSQDTAMIEAYASGDVYLAFAKSAGVVPQDATKKSHKRERDMCKQLVLGIQYDMSAKGLAPRLTQEMKREVTKEEAQALLNKFYDVYSVYRQWKFQVQEEYSDGYLQLADGWIMWGDNDNARSVGNFPVQGTGAVIMREAVRRAQDAGLSVIFTLHDALYIEYPSYKVEAIRVLMTCMQEAFQAIMLDPDERPIFHPIRLEGESWAKGYGTKEPELIKGVLYLEEYVDDKGRDDLERYRKYLSNSQTSQKE